MQVLRLEQQVVFLDWNSPGTAGHGLQQDDAMSSPTEAGMAGQVVDP